jgi:putative glutathione S-transferase
MSLTIQQAELDKKGGFKRQSNKFDKPFGDDPNKLPVEAGRYRILWSPVCPWAHRSIIVRKLLGLENIISVGTADPIRPDIPRTDWAFTLDKDNIDPVLKIKYISEVYQNADPNYNGRPTVPAVVDITTKKVVYNDYFKLTNYLETAWVKFHKDDAPNLYPEELRKDIDELNNIIFHSVNNGVYKAGFAQSQEAYEKAYDEVFKLLDELETRLENRRFLFGDYITDSDVRLYVTLARFDAAYYNGFRVNRNRLVEFPHLWAYARDLYQTPGFGDTTDFLSIKKHYHLSTIKGNTYKILPKGPDLQIWNLPHGREVLSKTPTQKFII